MYVVEVEVMEKKEAKEDPVSGICWWFACTPAYESRESVTGSDVSNDSAPDFLGSSQICSFANRSGIRRRTSSSQDEKGHKINQLIGIFNFLRWNCRLRERERERLTSDIQDIQNDKNDNNQNAPSQIYYPDSFGNMKGTTSILGI